MASDIEQRVLIIAPTIKDAELTSHILSESNVRCDLCLDIPSLVDEVALGAGAILIAEEILLNTQSQLLVELVQNQPPWSDLPIILVTRQGLESPAVTNALKTLGNVILVERPTRVIGLTNAVHNALRVRKRQYQARNLLVEHERIAQELRFSEQRYRMLVEQVKDYAIFMIDLSGKATSWNEGVLRVLGFAENEFMGLEVARHIFTLEDQLSGIPQEEFEVAARDGSASNDRWMRRKDGSHFWASGITSALYDPQGKHIGYTKVMRDLTLSKEAEDALKQADRRKDEFLATLAHELRNPLAPIRNSLHILKLAADKDGTLKNVCDMLERQVNNLVRLVDDLLEVSRITRGKIELRKEAVDLETTMRSALEISRPLIDAANHRLTVEFPAEPIQVWGDPVRLGQIFANLLNNAAKYTNEGGQIWFATRIEGDEVAISVRDNGVGIPAEMMPNVFELFMQVDRTTKRAQGGLGIGLTLVKTMVEMHGGTIRLHSEPSVPGSEFTVRLPLIKVDKSSPEIKSDPLKEKCTSFKGCRILVVDDNVDAATSLRILMKLQGAQVEVAHSGPAALEAIVKSRPHVILLDIGMPGMDGFEVVERIRQDQANDDVFVVALTGWGQEEDRRRTREAGFDHHLVKPANIAELQEVLANR